MLQKVTEAECYYVNIKRDIKKIIYKIPLWFYVR